MTYYDMIKENAAKYRGDEKTMWASIGNVSVLLEKAIEKHPDLKEEYWEFMREQHETMCGHHFNEAYAMWQVEQMHHKGDDGTEYKGAHWSVEDTNGFLMKYRPKIPATYNEWDFYVALNAGYHDFCRVVKKHLAEKADEFIIELAVAFWFLDEDWDGATKAWDYFAK